MKLPRNLSGAQLIRALERFGYQSTRQTGSHVRLTSTPLPNPRPMPSPQSSPASGRESKREKQLLIPAGEGTNGSLREFHVIEHHITIPLHDPLRIGTLAAILADVAAHHGTTREALIIRLFGK